jgi:hypothetical protein
MSTARRVGLGGLGVILIWAACGFWNSVKPLPPGLHVASLPARLSEAQVDFIDDSSHRGDILRRELDIIGHAEQAIVLDQCPLALSVAQQLLTRKRQRPNLKILLITDPRNQAYGGTPAKIELSLERAGIVVARTRLDRIRDSNPLYSSLWRLGMGWWSDPFDETPGKITLTSTLRHLNGSANERQLLVADDGAGGWRSMLMSAAPTANAAAAGTNVGVEIHEQFAHDMVASELSIAGWSTDDDRLPAAPPRESRGVGTIDARFLTEGAINSVLRDGLAVIATGDSVSLMARALNERQLISALLRAVGHGAHLRLLLDPDVPGTQAAAAELVRDGGGNVEVRWQAGANRKEARYALIQHGGDVWIHVVSANFTRRGLDDFNLAAGVELHMPARAAPARAAADLFATAWDAAVPYADHADESRDAYWQYRLTEATGLSMF